jgi:hypothetical protein
MTSNDFLLNLLTIYSDYQNNTNNIALIVTDLIEIINVILENNDRPNKRLKYSQNSSERPMVTLNIKSFQRFLTKTVLEYNYQPERCCDILRCKIHVNLNEDSVQSCRTKIVSKFNNVFLNENALIKLGKCKSNSEINGLILHWVTILDKNIINKIIQSSFTRFSPTFAHDTTEKIISPMSRFKQGKLLEDSYDYRIIDNKLKPIYSEVIDHYKPHLYRFEIQIIMGNKSGDHFNYEFNRLVLISDEFQLKIQQIMIREMINKSTFSISTTSSEEHIQMQKILEDLSKTTSVEDFNQILNRHKGLIVSF